MGPNIKNFGISIFTEKDTIMFGVTIAVNLATANPYLDTEKTYLSEGFCLAVRPGERPPSHLPFALAPEPALRQPRRGGLL